MNEAKENRKSENINKSNKCFALIFYRSLVMIVSLVYLSLVHLHRAYFDYGSYSLDITGPLMVITQKVTLLTFSIHDGIARNENELTKSQKFHAIRQLPTALEFFSYTLHFQGLMAGPLVFYKDYIEFIEGTHFLKHSNANVSISPTKFKTLFCLHSKWSNFIDSMDILFGFCSLLIKAAIKLLLNHHQRKQLSKKSSAVLCALTYLWIG